LRQYCHCVKITINNMNPDLEQTPESEDNVSYEAYRQAGGLLDMGHYKQALNVLEGGENRVFRSSTEAQAKNMATLAGLELSPKEESLYCFLREQWPLSDEESRENRAKTEGAYPPRRIDDKRLMADVLLLTQNAKALGVFKEKYPNISPSSPK